MSLTLFNTNGIEIVVNTRTGEAFTTQNGYTKLSGKPKQTVATRLDRLVLTGQVKKGDAATVFGVKVFKLISAKITLDWLQLDRPDLAAEVGDPTAYLHQLAGYTQPVKAKRQRKPKAVEVEPVAKGVRSKKAKSVEIVTESKVEGVSSNRTKSVEIVTESKVEGVSSNRTTPGLPSFATDLTILDFSGKRIRFERRGNRIWVNLTDMAKATGKLVADYTRLKSATEFLSELESIMGIPIMLSNTGGTPEKTGTWAIEEVAIDFAAWCNVSFRIWIAQQIRTLMTEGTVTIAKPAPEPTPPPAPQLPGDIRMVQMVATLKELDIELLNPRIKQGLQDLALDMLGVRQPALTAENISSREGVWCGVVERAEHLGYSVELILQHRSILGRHVAKQIGGAVKENRLCNGTYRPINLYRVSDELDATISDYFDNL